MGLKDFFKKKAKDVMTSEIAKYTEAKMEGKKPVVVENTMAAINIVKFRVERVLFYVGVISSAVFLLFYVSMIYSSIVSDKLTHIIVYSLLGLILVASSVFDIILYPGKKIRMNFIERKKFNDAKTLKRNITMMVKTGVKLFSLGYALFELLTIDATRLRIITLVLSFTAFVIQTIIYFISTLIIRYSNYLYIGFKQDMEMSGVFNFIDKDNREIIKANELLRTDGERKIIEEISKQVEIDRENNLNDRKIKLGLVDNQEEHKPEENEVVEDSTADNNQEE